MESSRVGSLRDKRLHFPWKLHQVLDETSSSSDFCNVIAWMPDGKSFKIFNKELLEKEVMPQHFSSSKFKSFQRSLNLWGFRVVQAGKEKGQCYHPLFIRGKPDLCCNMERTKVKVPGRRTNKATLDRPKGAEDEDAPPPSSEASSPVIPTNTAATSKHDLIGHSLPLSSTTSPLLRNTTLFANDHAGGILDTSPPSPTRQATTINPTSPTRLAVFQAVTSSHGGSTSSIASMGNNRLAMNASVLAGLLVPPPFMDDTRGRNHHDPLFDAIYSFATLERIRQEQQMTNDAISSALLAMKILSQHRGKQESDPY